MMLLKPEHAADLLLLSVEIYGIKKKKKQQTLAFLLGVISGADWTLHLLCIIRACCKNHIVFKLQCTFYY